jgi:ribosomal protein S11
MHCFRVRTYSSLPVPPSTPPAKDATETEDVPATWPSREEISEPESEILSTSPLLDLLPIYTSIPSDLHSINAQGISAFLPSTAKTFYPSDAAPELTKNVNPNLKTEDFDFHIHVNTMTDNVLVNITDHTHDCRIVHTAHYLGFKHTTRLQIRAAGAATADVAMKDFVEKYPDILKKGKMEIVVRGQGPGQTGALATILGPSWGMLRDRILRVRDATKKPSVKPKKKKKPKK